MSNFIINGGKKLSGSIKTNSAKNSAVAILCATAMIKGITTLKNVPEIEEVKRIIEILSSIGIKIKWTTANKLTINNPGKIDLSNIDKEAFIKTRSGLLLIGALSLSKSSFRLPKASGCHLGKRTVSPYIIAMKHLGISVIEKTNFFAINKKKPHGAEFTMYEAGDTATENTLMAAIGCPGKTKIYFASSNYMTQDLCHFLVCAGAKIDGIGTSTLSIHGNKKLRPVKNFSIMPDPIESMAFISIAITTKSQLTIKNCPIDFLRLELEKLKIMGQKMTISSSYHLKKSWVNLVDIKIIPSKLKALPDKLHPLPYPGLNIDNLPLFLPILTRVKGETLVHDWVYEDRAIYYMELKRLGLQISLLDPHRVIVKGPSTLKPAEIICPPALRPSINLLICMLAVKGKSILRNSYPIDRGYEKLVTRLNKLGANIQRLE